MKMNKKISILLGITALVLGVSLITPKEALAYKGDATVKGPNYTQERHEAMTRAFETKNYNAWKSLMTGNTRVTQVINAQNFARFAEAHQLSLQGKNEEAKAIRAELGLGLKNGSGMGQNKGQCNHTR